MRITKVLPYTFYKHKSGRSASIRGACPWVSDADKANWTKVTQGWTWEVVDNRGNITYGLGRKPAETEAEALQVMREYNKMFL
jgi:hypothetical protein